ncbi:LPXTG cell wall anchor domain-containing protein [Arthrobacter sp. B10-11]|uniref:LPXTG cell wall anchor domain-containing protein n=1 Tax=Arthrobacter sp. B10-11 TaxID=3081160 RepID=UPI0029558B31|nr:LPXTG cell wall anchor domain-containing protein [Arthrobacter sp. B10-11]MDV8146996.1 LPXTG cell wall anchor domain-containing protein [Arthrobacter sp. B10-11]
MKKTLAAIALAGSITLIGAAPSMAANYPPLPPQAAVSDGTVGPGEQFVFRGQGFLAGEGLTISVNPGSSPAATGASVANGSRTVSGKITLPLAPQTFAATADANGAFAVPLTISEAGTYSLTATGASGRTVGPVTVVVVAPAGLANTGGAPLANTGAALANTGADASLVLWSLVGAGALAAGATSVVVVRRRAKAEAAA